MPCVPPCYKNRIYWPIYDQKSGNSGFFVVKLQHQIVRLDLKSRADGAALFTLGQRNAWITWDGMIYTASYTELQKYHFAKS